MVLLLDRIPNTSEKPLTTEPSAALSGLDFSSRRRTVLGMLAASSLALGGNILSWTSPRSMSRAAAETSPGGLLGWNNCDNIPDYIPQPDTSGAYAPPVPAACHGGVYMGKPYCNSNGWHRNDTVAQGPSTVDYSPVSSRCWPGDGRNAWRWQAGGYWYRCSDGNAYACASGGCDGYKTVCRFRV